MGTPFCVTVVPFGKIRAMRRADLFARWRGTALGQVTGDAAQVAAVEIVALGSAPKACS